MKFPCRTLQVRGACGAGQLELEAVHVPQEAGVRLGAAVHPARLRAGLDGQVAGHRADRRHAAEGRHRPLPHARAAL